MQLLYAAEVAPVIFYLPELMVSVTSAIKGHAEIAMGNAIGSIICNIGLILGFTSLLEVDYKRNSYRGKKTESHIGVSIREIGTKRIKLAAGGTLVIIGARLLLLYAVYLYITFAISWQGRVFMQMEGNVRKDLI